MIKISKFSKTCNHCPSQWECLTDDNQYVYIRYRHGYLRAGMAESEREFFYGNIGENIYNVFNEKIGEEYDGSMTTKEMIERLSHKLDFSNSQEEDINYGE